MNRLGKSVVGAIAGLVIFVGLPLLSWGPGSVGTFVGDRGRLAYLVVAALLTLAVAAAVPPPSRSRGVEDKVVPPGLTVTACWRSPPR